MSSNANYNETEVFEGSWGRKQIMEMFDRLPREIREAIAYADADYSIEELYTDPNIRLMSRDELLALLWEHSDGFEIRYPQYARVQYERVRAASYRNHYGSDRDLGGDSVEILHGRYPFGPLR